jgi:hypothetical protein
VGGRDRDSNAQAWLKPRCHRRERMLAPELARGADRWRVAVYGILVVGNVGPGIVAIAPRFENGVSRFPIVVVYSQGQQRGQDVRQR